MESSNESDEAKAHHKDDSRADLQTWRIIGVETEHIASVAGAYYGVTTTASGGRSTEPASAHASCSGGGTTGCGGTWAVCGGGGGLGRSASRHYLGSWLWGEIKVLKSDY